MIACDNGTGEEVGCRGPPLVHSPEARRGSEHRHKWLSVGGGPRRGAEQGACPQFASFNLLLEAAAFSQSNWLGWSWEEGIVQGPHYGLQSQEDLIWVSALMVKGIGALHRLLWLWITR